MLDYNEVFEMRLKKYGYAIERNPNWLSLEALKLACNYEIEETPAILDSCEPGCVRIYGAYSKVLAYRQIIKELLKSPFVMGWFASQPLINFTMMRAPKKGHGKQNLHRDSQCFSKQNRRRELLAAIYLDHTDSMNGGPSFIPSSHLERLPLHKRATSPRMDSGTVVWFSPRIVHGGRKNRTGTQRRMLLVSICESPLLRQRTDGDRDPIFYEGLSDTDKCLICP